MLTLSDEYKLSPNQLQIDMIEQTLGVCRTVGNYALTERKDGINSRKCPINGCSIEKEYIIPPDEPYPSYSRQAKALTEAKKDSERLKSVNAQVLQQVLRTLARFCQSPNRKINQFSESFSGSAIVLVILSIKYFLLAKLKNPVFISLTAAGLRKVTKAG